MADETTFKRWVRTASSEVWVLQGDDDGEATMGELHLHHGEAGRVSATLCLDERVADDEVGFLLGMLHEQLLKQDGRNGQELLIHVWRGRHEQYAYQAQDEAKPPATPRGRRARKGTKTTTRRRKER